MPADVTALVFQDDELALPVLFHLRQYGRRVPRDLSIVGFDDVPMAAAVGLTTVHQDPFALGAAAAAKTLAAVAGRPADPAFDSPSTPLMLRETTAPRSGSPS